jgi:hypothetical protein
VKRDAIRVFVLQFVVKGLGDAEGSADFEAAVNKFAGDGWVVISTTVYRSPEAGCDVLFVLFGRPVALPSALRVLGASVHVPPAAATLPEGQPHEQSADAGVHRDPVEATGRPLDASGQGVV